MTAKIYQFPKKQIGPVQVMTRDGKIVRRSSWMGGDGLEYILNSLKGRRPRGHPNTIKRNKRGQAILKAGQVWVEPRAGYYPRLWIVEFTDPCTDGRTRVFLSPYKVAGPCERIERILLERTFRNQMKIWDDVSTRLLDLPRELF